MAHDRQVVADEQQREAELGAQIGQQLHDLRLDRDVERADRLVGDEEIGAGRKRARDADALALAAGEFVREAAPRALDRARPAPAARQLVLRAFAVGADRGWRGRRRSARRRARRGSRLPIGVLEDRSACAGAARATPARTAPRSLPVEPHAPGGRLDQAEQQAPERALAASRTRRRRRPPRRAPISQVDVAHRLHLAARGRTGPAQARSRTTGPRRGSGRALMRTLSQRRCSVSDAVRRRSRAAAGRRGMAGGDRARRSAERSGSRRGSACGGGTTPGMPAGRVACPSGTRRAARACRDGSGAAKTSPTGPCSTTWPAYITATRSAISATTPRLCVMNISAMPALAPQVGEQVEDLRLDGDVERGGRLVGDQQARAVGDRHRDHHALAHAARELVRKGARAPLRIGDADAPATARPPRPAPPPRTPRVAMRRGSPRRPASPTRCTGLRLLIGSWKTIAIASPRSWRSSGSGRRQQVASPGEPDGAGDDSRGGRQQAQQGQRGQRLARAALADDARASRPAHT